jgi:hypothetical protein
MKVLTPELGVFVIAALCAIGLSLHASRTHHSDPMPNADVTITNTHQPRLLAPGDPDYPTLNLADTQIIEFTAVVPPTISSEFHLIYVVDLEQPETWSSYFVSPHGCHWTQESPFAIDLLLKLKKDGNTYKGRFKADQFLPGACGWHLVEITNSDYIDPYSPHNLRPILLYTLRSFAGNAGPSPVALPAESLDPHLYIWCSRRTWTSPQFPQARGKLFCTSFDAITFLVPNLPPEFVKSVPAGERSWDMWLSRYARSLTIEFFDLDALLDANSKRRQ